MLISSEALKKGKGQAMSTTPVKIRPQVLEMIGKRFGHLVVIAHQSRATGYLCQCDCGNTTVAKTYALKTGRHQSCRCGLRKSRPQTHKPEHHSAKWEVWRNYRQAARRRGYSFELDQKAFFGLIVQPCCYCGATESMISPLKAHPDFFYSGVDRVDNDKGYAVANCVACCDLCNRSKSTLTTHEWLEWLKRLYTYQYAQGTFND